jgi:hypothetical protein
VPKNSLLNWPFFADTLSPYVEVLRKSPPDTVSSNDRQFTLRQVLTITSFDSGYHAIPPLRFVYSIRGDTTGYFTETSPVFLSVTTVETDEKADIKPIKPPLRAPVTLREILIWAGIALLLAALGFLIYNFLVRKKAAPPVVRTRLKPTIPADEAALEALEMLRHKKLWQSGRVKEYYSEMTEIVREYIELRYPIRALEMTTQEIAAALRKDNVNPEALEKISRTLTLADLVKFAKEQPLPMENDLSLNHCVDFVRETRPPKVTGPQASQSDGPNLQNPGN